MKKNERSIIFILIFMIFGIVIALQFKSTLYTKKITASNTLNTDKLVEQITAEKKIIEELRLEVDGNISKKYKFINEYLKNNMDVESAGEFDKIKLKAGFTDVRGPGITIKLDDAAARQEDTPLDWLIIHDQDIKIIVNDLKKSGAQAISINGERVVPMSEQECAGPTIMVNNNRYSVPYVIEAIGDPEILYNNVVNSARVAEMLEYKIRIEITKSKELKINKFSGMDHISRLISGMEEIKK
ncbi:MAG: DUF881 domain-containing protein [Ruminiclostridium sp.]|nr:DUF881 domain-containing protein [Ruminiclostridium sp.]